VNGTGLMLSDDLMFFSRVAGTARAGGLSVKQARTTADLLARAKQEPPAGVILDLQNDGLDLPTLLTGLRDACHAMPRVIAFGSHVEAETLRAAREAGCDRVMPRSKFVAVLEAELKEWLAAV
jgi:CheY-like chemotaxis protein